MLRVWRWECEGLIPRRNTFDWKTCYAGGKGDKKHCYQVAKEHKMLNPTHKPVVWKEK